MVFLLKLGYFDNRLKHNVVPKNLNHRVMSYKLETSYYAYGINFFWGFGVRIYHINFL